MLNLTLGAIEAELSILLIGAHCDDIEIGCGATVLQLVDRYPAARFDWVVLSSDEVRGMEARNAASEFLKGAENSNVVIEGFRDGFLPYLGFEVKECFEQLKGSIQPDIIFTHYRGDAHQDHRLVCELTWNTWRDHLILEYEVPKFDGDLGSPNVFVNTAKHERAEKLRILIDCYGSQLSRSWFSEETFLSLMRLRGIECNARSGYAEAFYVPKAPLAI